MGFLTDLWKQISEFFEIKAVEPIVPEEPPKPHEPIESVTTLPEKPIAEVPTEEIEPLPPVKIIEPIPIGEQGRADRIEVLPAKEEPEPEEYPCTVHFHTRCEGMPVAGVDVTFLGQTETTDSSGKCSINGRAKVMEKLPITASKAGYKTIETEIAFAFAPRSGLLGADNRLDMERL